MLQIVGVMAARARRGFSRVVVACGLLAVAGCGGGGTTDLRPMSGTATLATQPSATLVSQRPCFIWVIDGKDVGHALTVGFGHKYVVAPGIHVVQIWYSDGQKYSTVNAEIGLVVTAGHTYRAENWPPVFWDDTTNQRAQQSLRGPVR
jgi:hypothetical protein